MNIRQKLRIGNEYPYMYARVSARRAKLLEREEYEDLSKMQTGQIANRLEEGDYGREIDELGTEYSGAELIELAVNRNLARTMSKLIDISPNSLENVLKVYLRRYDIETLKRILRWKRNGKEKDIGSLMMPVNNFTFEEIEEMLEKNYTEILENIGFKGSTVDYQRHIKDAEDLKQTEAAMDEAYYKELRQMAEKVGSRQFSRFVKEELENDSIGLILRLKKGGESQEKIEEMIDERRTKLVDEVIQAEEYEQAVSRAVESGKVDHKESLEEIEQSMKVKRLEKALQMLHTEPLGVTSILGYVVAKMIEAENLKVLAQAREAGVDGDQIMENLVIA